MKITADNFMGFLNYIRMPNMIKLPLVFGLTAVGLNAVGYGPKFNIHENLPAKILKQENIQPAEEQNNDATADKTTPVPTDPTL
ncbi:hypothetical protein HY837_02360, partial [archaeon]|nr:hypothetical protein [archaeon]